MFINSENDIYSEIKHNTVGGILQSSVYYSMDRNTGKYGSSNQLVLKNRSNEKRELGYLNDRFASYIERLKILELRNKRLLNIKQSFTSASDSYRDKLLEFYQSEIASVQSTNENVKRELPTLNAKLNEHNVLTTSEHDKHNQLKENYQDIRKKIRKLNEEHATRSTDILLFKQRLEDIIDETERCNYQKTQANRQINFLRESIEHEQMKIQILRSNKESIIDEMSLLSQTQQCEVEEFLQTLIDLWRNEKINTIGKDLSQAICNAREEYETQVDSTRSHLMKKYEQIVSHTREKNAMSSEQPMTSIIERMKRLRRNMKGEIDNCKATLSFLRLKENDFNKAIGEERDESLKYEQMHRGEVIQIQDQIDKLEKNIEEALKSQVTFKNEIDGYRTLLEGNSENQGLRNIVESIGTQDELILPETTIGHKNNSNGSLNFKEYNSSYSSITRNR